MPAVKAAVLVQLPALHVLSDNFIPILPLLLAALFIPRQFNAERAFFARVGRAVSVALVVYIVFFLTGASTVDQPRYWIVPASLACGLGLIFAVDLWQKQQFSLPKVRLAIAALVLCSRHLRNSISLFRPSQGSAYSAWNGRLGA